MTYEENFGGEGPFNLIGEPEYGIIVGFSDKAIQISKTYNRW